MTKKTFTVHGCAAIFLLSAIALPATAAQVVHLTRGRTVNNTNYNDNYYYNTNTIIGSGSATYNGTTSFNWANDNGSSDLLGLDFYVSPNQYEPTSVQNFDYADGVLAYQPNVGSGSTTLTVPSGSTVQGIFSGNGWGLASGIEGVQYNGNSASNSLTINNSGTCDGEVKNNDGVAAGISGWSTSGGVAVTNNSSGVCTASASYYTTGIYELVYNGNASVTSWGRATATTSGATHQWLAGNGYAVGTDLFSYAGNATFNNYGTSSASSAGTTFNVAYGAFLWAEGSGSSGGNMTLNNTGVITATGRAAKGVYCGGNKGTQTITNSGQITGTATTNDGWGLAVENDGTNAINVTNSGYIGHNTGLGVGVFIGSGTTTITNYGTIFGGTTGISAQTFQGPIVVNDSGDVGCGSSGNGAMVFGPGNITVNMSSLPTISGTMVGGSGNNRLVFSLNGTLQKVNGATATHGNSLSNYSLGTSGNIVVSGKTYAWQNFNVSGTA